MQLRPAFAAVAVMALLAGCGDEDGATTATTTDPLPAGRAELRNDPFNREWGAICEDFYREVGPKQQELEELQVTASSSAEDRQHAVELVKEIQALSDEFIADIKAAPLPQAPEAREDAEKLIESLDTFRSIQEGYFEGIIDAIETGDESQIEEPELLEAQTALNNELTKQKALLVRLGLPECASAPSG